MISLGGKLSCLGGGGEVSPAPPSLDETLGIGHLPFGKYRSGWQIKLC